jgi:hypothetical protein
MSSTMDTKQVISCLQNTLSNNNRVRKDAEKLMEQVNILDPFIHYSVLSFIQLKVDESLNP